MFEAPPGQERTLEQRVVEHVAGAHPLDVALVVDTRGCGRGIVHCFLREGAQTSTKPGQLQMIRAHTDDSIDPQGCSNDPVPSDR